jgi:hypothetical protein
VLAVLPFSQSLGGAFVYDDHALIEERAAVHSLARLPELWKGEFWQGLAPIHFRYFRPIVSTSYALDWAVYGGRPAGFHVTNLVLHAAIAWLLFAALRRWSGPLLGESAAPWGALVATVAWAWHPSKVEAVSWIAGRTDLLCAAGILVTCVGVRRRLSATRAGAAARAALLEALGLLVAFGSKESAVVVPAFVAVEAWAYFGGGASLRADLPRALRVALPHVAVVALYVAARALLLPIVPERAGSLSFVDGRLFAFETLGEFARVSLWPPPFSIERAPIRVDAAFHVLHDPARLALGVVTAVVVAIGAFAQWPGATWRRVGWVLGAAALLPVSNVVSARNVFLFAERFAYVPLMGFALFALPRAIEGWARGPWAIVLGASFALSAAHTRDFLDDRSLWTHELSVHPSDPLALRFSCEDAMRRHDDKLAIELAVRGYEASAGWPLARADRVEFAMRAARSLELVTFDHDRATLQEILAFYRAFLDRTGVARLDRLSVPIRIEPTDAEAKMFLEGDRARVATTRLWAGALASRLGDCDVATPLVREYLRNEGDPTGRVTAALVLGRCGEWTESLAVARSLAATDPRHQALVANLEWARGVLDTEPDASCAATAERALECSRAHTLLFDRGRAFRVLAPWETTLVGDRAAALFFARAAWAAGEDPAARRALAAHLAESESTPLLSSWSRELGRD